jgi:hypothetical protein
MKHSLLKTTGSILATVATLLFAPALTHAGVTVIDRVPYNIAAPGEYVMQSDLTANGTFGISVHAANVTINLGGFTLAEGAAGEKNTGIDVFADNVTVRNGTITGFYLGVSLLFSNDKVQDLQLLGEINGGILVARDDNAVLNCLIIGPGKDSLFVGVHVLSNSGTIVKDSRISKCYEAISSGSRLGSAFLHNYVANSANAFELSDADCYQGNVVTSCDTAFEGGHAVGGENGSD